MNKIPHLFQLQGKFKRQIGSKILHMMALIFELVVQFEVGFFLENIESRNFMQSVTFGHLFIM